MNEEIIKIVQNIENNIRHCDILNKLLIAMRNNNDLKDYRYFYDKGYNSDEINLGEKLIELYLMLKDYVNQIDS